MFFVIYEFEISLNHEKEFQEVWHQLTLHIRNNYGGCGSRLHKDVTKPNVYVAYAKWPDQNAWKQSGDVNDEDFATLRTRMKSFCTNIRTIYQLEMIEDLLL